MQVLIDYLTLTSRVHSHWNFLQDLGAQDCSFIEMSGRYGWQSRLYYHGISVYFGGSREDVCLEISGTGCRMVEELSSNTFDWFSFLSDFQQHLKNGEVNISRLDIAGDDREGLLSFHRMILHCKHHRYICKARWRIWIDGDEQAIYFGSPKSDRRLRIYNKALEQGLEEHWVRCELQMRDKNAVSFLLNWFALKEIGPSFGGVLLDFLRFTRTAPTQNNHQRCDVMLWWTKFVGEVCKCPQLYIHGGSWGLADVQNFLERQAASSLKLWLEANNGDFTDIIDMIEGAHLNYRQQMLLDKIRMEEKLELL